MRFILRLSLYTLVLLYAGDIVGQDRERTRGRSGNNEAKPLEISINHSPWRPFEYEEDGVSKGMNLEIVKATLTEMGFTPKFKQYPWKRAEEDAKTGKADAVFSMGIFEERKEYFLFPSEPMVDVKRYIYFPKGKVVPFEKDLQALEGLRIGTARGYIYPEYFMNSTLIKRKLANSDLINLKKTRVDRLDAFICDNINCPLLIRENGFQGVFETYQETPIDVNSMYIGFSKKSPLVKDHYPNIHKRFSDTLKRLKEEGVIAEIKQKYGVTD